jgi:rubrerythrin
MLEPGPASPLEERLDSGSFRCSVCGYGIACSTPLDRCPMCQGEDTWIHMPRRAGSGA